MADFCAQICYPTFGEVSPLSGPATCESCFRKVFSQGSRDWWISSRASMLDTSVYVMSFGYPNNPVKLLFLNYSCGNMLRDGTEGHTAKKQRRKDLSLVLSNVKPSVLKTN